MFNFCFESFDEELNLGFGYVEGDTDRPNTNDIEWAARGIYYWSSSIHNKDIFNLEMDQNANNYLLISKGNMEIFNRGNWDDAYFLVRCIKRIN